MSSKEANRQLESAEAIPTKVGLYALGAPLAGEPKAYISKADAKALVKCDRAEWRSDKSKVQLLHSDPDCRGWDQSSTMGPGVVERAVLTGSNKDLQRVASWKPNQRGLTVSEKPDTRKAA